MTRNVTEKSVMQPWKIEMITYFCPQVWEIIGRVVSIVVAPPTEMGARGPNRCSSRGAAIRAVISRITLLRSEIVPNSAPLYCEMITLDRE